MGNRPAGYWILLIVAIAAVAASFIMRSSADLQMREISKYVGYGAIALLVIARIAFRRKVDPTPPMPRD
ncbi:MAG TPA: hypothetical protein VH724_16055 [Candidatus Angelobacter sp.]|nr:hypothetical protein [Candidatus Angelobacter sp.]